MSEVTPKKLAALMTLLSPSEEEEARAKMPSPAEVVYTGPNKDGSRKKCGNCALWAEMDKRCLLHARDLEIVAEQVCTYHVYGSTQLFATAINGNEMDVLDPKLSGLELTKDGTSCDNCKAYNATGRAEGKCAMVVDPKGKPAIVQSRGCCSRWMKA